MDYRVRRLNQYVRRRDDSRLAHTPRKFSDRTNGTPSAATDPVEAEWETAADAGGERRALGVGLIWPGSGHVQSWLLAYCEVSDSAPGVADQLLAGTWCRVLSPSLGQVSNDLANRRMRGPAPSW